MVIFRSKGIFKQSYQRKILKVLSSSIIIKVLLYLHGIIKVGSCVVFLVHGTILQQ